MISKVTATNYGIGVNKNEDLIWKCKVCNNAEMDVILGTDWDNSGIFTNLSQGTRMRWKINSAEINSTMSSIEYDIWYWTASDNWGTKDNISRIEFLVDPNDYSENYSFLNNTSFVPFWFPIPVGEYIGGLSLKLNIWYDVDNRVLPTINVDIPKDNIVLGYPNKDIKIIALYNDQGILNSYKLYGKGNTVIIDIVLDSLPFYVIPSLIGLVTVITVSIILYFKKKKRFKSIVKEKI
jgi:hypothetical protein